MRLQTEALVMCLAGTAVSVIQLLTAIAIAWTVLVGPVGYASSNDSLHCNCKYQGGGGTGLTS